MNVQDKFSLLKNVNNVLRLSSSAISKAEISNVPRKLNATLQINERRISHYTKDYIYGIVSDPKKRDIFKIVTMSDYLLPVSYNVSSRGIIINLKAEPFKTDDISQVDPRNLYACLVYGLCFSNLVTGKTKLPDSYAYVIINYLLSVFIRLFGKEYGLVGVYATEIPKLKFLLSCYIYTSFFGLSNSNEIYKKSSTIAGFDYRQEKDQLDKFDFSKIESFVDALSKMRVMPGISRYSFTAKFLRHLGINFLPAIEDLSRFVSTLVVSTVSGSTIVPKFIYTYNETEFVRIIDISKRIFR